MTPLPVQYEIRVQGHLDEHWAAWLDVLQMTHHEDGTSTFSTHPVDQAGLHGLLARLRDVGTVLVSVASVEGTFRC